MNRSARHSARQCTLNLSAKAKRLSEIEEKRVFHRLLQSDLASRANIKRRWYLAVLCEPWRATEDLLARLEQVLKGEDDAAANRGRDVPSDYPERLALSAYFVQAACHYGICPVEARALLVPGQEKPADPAWRVASHVRQAALYLANQALGISQTRLAAFVGLTPAAVCLALRQVEDRRADPGFEAFCDFAMAPFL